MALPSVHNTLIVSSHVITREGHHMTQAAEVLPTLSLIEPLRVPTGRYKVSQRLLNALGTDTLSYPPPQKKKKHALGGPTAFR